jgi:hypothetical protein
VRSSLAPRRRPLLAFAAVVVLAVAALVVALRPGRADAVVSSTFLAGTLTVESSVGDGDAITVECSGGLVAVSGVGAVDELGAAVPCADVTAIVVLASDAADNVNLGAVSAAAGFSGAPTIDVQAGDGDDVVVPAGLPGTYVGGAGTDRFVVPISAAQSVWSSFDGEVIEAQGTAGADDYDLAVGSVGGRSAEGRTLQVQGIAGADTYHVGPAGGSAALAQLLSGVVDDVAVVEGGSGSDTFTVASGGIGGVVPVGPIAEVRVDGGTGIDEFRVALTDPGALARILSSGGDDRLVAVGGGTADSIVVAVRAADSISVVGDARFATFRVDGAGGDDVYAVAVGATLAEAAGQIVDGGGAADRLRVVGTAGADTFTVSTSSVNSVGLPSGVDRFEVDGAEAADTYQVPSNALAARDQIADSGATGADLLRVTGGGSVAIGVGTLNGAALPASVENLVVALSTGSDTITTPLAGATAALAQVDPTPTGGTDRVVVRGDDGVIETFILTGSTVIRAGDGAAATRPSWADDFDVDGGSGADTYERQLDTPSDAVGLADGDGGLVRVVGNGGDEVFTVTPSTVTRGAQQLAFPSAPYTVQVDGREGSDTYQVQSQGAANLVLDLGTSPEGVDVLRVTGPSSSFTVNSAGVTPSGGSAITRPPLGGGLEVLEANGLGGSDTYTVDFASPPASSTRILDSGAVGDGSDVLNVTAAGATTVSGTSVSQPASGAAFALGGGLETLAVTGTGGADSITVSSNSTPVTVNGGSGADSLTVVPLLTGDLTSGAVPTAGGTISYSNIDTLAVNASGSVAVTSTSAATTFHTGAGDDTVTVSLNGLTGSLDLVDTAGSDTVSVLGTSAPESITVAPAGTSLNGHVLEFAAGFERWVVDGRGNTDQLTVSGTPALAVEVDGGDGNGDTITVSLAGIGGPLTARDTTGTGDRVVLNATAGADAVVVGPTGITLGVGFVGIGAGIDAMTVDGLGAADSADVTLAPGTATLGSSLTYPTPVGGAVTLANVESVVLRSGALANAVTVTATPASLGTTLVLGSGNDVVTVDLAGLAGPFALIDGGGTDTVVARGGAGADTVTVSPVAVARSGSNPVPFAAGFERWLVDTGGGTDAVNVSATPGQAVEVELGTGNDDVATLAIAGLVSPVAVTDAGGTGDRVDVNGTDGVDALVASGAGVTDGVHNAQAGAGIDTIRLNALGGNDAVTASPAATIRLELSGGAGTFDSLVVASSGLQVTANGNTFNTVGRQPIAHQQFEVVSLDENAFIGTGADDSFTVFSTTAAGSRIDLLGGSDHYTALFGFDTGLLGPARFSDTGASGVDDVRAVGTGAADQFAIASGRVTRSPAEHLDLGGIERVHLETGGGDDSIAISGIGGTIQSGLSSSAPGAGIVIDGGAGTDSLLLDAGGRTVTRTGTHLVIDGLAPIDLFGIERLDIVGSANGDPGFSLNGYWLVATDGGIFSYGDAGFFGSTGAIRLNRPIVGMAPTPSGRGYWLVASDGGIFSYGDAGFFGSTGAITLNKPIVGMASTPSGRGYWLVASDGGIFAFGDAGFYGSTGAITLNKPIVGMASTPSGQGYWLVASDGGIFAFGDAGFFGSTGAITLNQPIVGIATAPGGAGYWMVATDGGIFAFGQAPFFGSAANAATTPVAGIVPTVTGSGYWIITVDGKVFNYGDAPFLGEVSGALVRPVVGAAANT